MSQARSPRQRELFEVTQCVAGQIKAQQMEDLLDALASALMQVLRTEIAQANPGGGDEQDQR